MLEFLQTNWGSFAVGAVVLAVIVLIVMKLVRDKKAGRYTCGGNCGSCGACSGNCAGCQECSNAAPAKPAEKKK
jgi:hypothetical protein